MKLGDTITEQKKVRCSGCGAVILVEPHPTNPGEVTTSIPKRRDKPKGMSDTMRRNILMAIVAVLILIMAIGIWWTQSGPSLTAAVAGDVTLDAAPLVKGWIIFVPLDTSKGVTEVKIPIERGSYSIRASRGPLIGMNKVQILGNEIEIVAKEYNTESDLTFDIKAGPNKADFKVTSK
jgi:hypothetical protein